MRILVADDHEDTAQSCRMLLELLGHEVCTAANGRQAVELASSFQPALAMLDIGMPDVNGFQAARQIRAALPDVTLVAVSGWHVRGGDTEYKAAGFDYYLLKPVDPLVVCDLLNTRTEKIERQ